MQAASGLIAGLLFGLGLVISGMANPAKVLNFLDVTGVFDPSLALVMAGAAGVTLLGYRLARRRQKPLFDERFHYPARTGIDGRLIAGAAIFGLGWGLAGFCPGPALASLWSTGVSAPLFVACMLVGFWFERLFAGPRDPL
jgi:uncharacterized protein